MKSLVQIFTNEPGGRNLTADFLKGTAVLFMIQVHVTELLAQPDFYFGWAGSVSLFLGGPPAAPVFMAVMGYFLAGSKKPLSAGLLRGIKLIAGGILLNVLLNASLLYKIYSGELFLNPWHYILGADILPLAGLSVMLIALFRKIFNDSLWVGVGFLILVILVNQFLPRGVLQENEYIRYALAFLFTNEYWSYFPLFPWLVYPFAGYLFRLIEPGLSFTDTMLKVLAAGLAAFMAGAGQFFYQDIIRLPLWYHHKLWLIVFNFIFLAGYIALFRLTAEHFKKNGLLLWISWLGKNVTVAYVIQWIILGNAGTHLYKTVSWQWLGVWFVSVCVIVTFFTILFNKSKGLYESRGV